MKRISLIALLALSGMLFTWMAVPEIGLARIFSVYGPENFVRSIDGPVTRLRQFQVADPDAYDFSLHLFHVGNTSGFANAHVMMNGRPVVTPRQFNHSIPYVETAFQPVKKNRLAVSFLGKAGKAIRAVIIAKNEEPQHVFVDKDFTPDGTNLFGPGLGYMWTLLSAPEGANVMISDPLSPSPAVRVDIPGDYSLELRVRGTGWESEPVMVKITATAESPLYPNFVPVPVQTRVVSGAGTLYSDYSIHVGSTTYTAPAPTNCGSPTNSGFQVLVLDRSTLAKKDHQTFNVPCGSTSMLNYLNTLDTSSLVIISSLYSAEPASVCGSFPMCNLGNTLRGFGASSVFTSNWYQPLSYKLPDGTPVQFSYSLIGIKGLGIDNGVELSNYDHKALRLDARVGSNIEGAFVQYLNADLTSSRTFAYPEFIEIETRARPTATSNTIKVSDPKKANVVSYASEPLSSGAVGGFQVLALDRDTLEPAVYLSQQGIKTNVTFSTNSGTGTGSVSESEQKRMYDWLNSLKTDTFQRYTVIFASIGTPIGYKSTYYTDLIKAIANYFGGTIGVLNSLGSGSTYSLVGTTNPVFYAYPLGVADIRDLYDYTESVSVEASSPGENLRVVMHKDNKGWFVPAATDVRDATVSASGPDFSLLSVALEPYTPWPLPDPSDPLYSEQVAAYQYIGIKAHGSADIRSQYTLNPIDPGAWQSTCNALTYPPTTTNPPVGYFSEPVFRAMQAQLCDPVEGEFNYVNLTNIFMHDLDTVLTDMQISSMGTLATVYETVKAVVKPPDTSKVLWDTLIVVRGILTAGSVVVPNMAVKATMGAINGALFIGMKLFSKTPAGADYTKVNTEAASLATQMDNLWSSCKSGKDILFDMVKSDWGKLQYVGKKFMTSPDETPENGGPGWMYGDSDKSVWKNTIQNSLEAYYFQNLLPTVFSIDYLQETTISVPKNFTYDRYDRHNIVYWCTPYCANASNNTSAYWIDHYASGKYSWYVLADAYKDDYVCIYVDFDHSTTIRDVLFGSGQWCDTTGCHGIKLAIPPAVFYERWLPSTSYRAAIDGGYSRSCSGYNP